MKTTIAMVAFGLLSSLSAVAVADAPKKSEKDVCTAIHAKDPKARCKNVDLGTETIDGTNNGPMMENSTGRGETQHGSLIKPRLDFLDKIVASAADL